MYWGRKETDAAGGVHWRRSDALEGSKTNMYGLRLDVRKDRVELHLSRPKYSCEAAEAERKGVKTSSN
jgi:hypothetical protein